MKRKVPSGGFILACIINYFEFTFIWGVFTDFRVGQIVALPTLILTYVITYAILKTPLVDFYYKYKLSLRIPTETEGKRIKSAWDLVLRGGADKNIRIPANLNIYVINDNQVGAFAVGSRIIVVHTALLMKRFSDEEIAGVLGHELGHIVNGDTVSLLISMQGSKIFDGIIWLYKAMAWLMQKVIRLLFTFIGIEETEGDICAGISVGRIAEYFFMIPGKIIDLFAWFFIRVETAGYMLFNRKDEFAADKFSVSIGLGNGLRDCLLQISKKKEVNKFSIEYILQGTHPPISERVEKIDNMLYLAQDSLDKENAIETENVEETFKCIDKTAEITRARNKYYSEKDQFEIALQRMQTGDEKHGFSLLKILADKEYPKAYTEVGKCYLYGIGVERNINSAVLYLKKALEFEDAEGIYLLAECYASVKDRDKYSPVAFKCYYKSAKLGYKAAIAKVGLCCLEGKGTEKNEKVAYNLLRTAVEINNDQRVAYFLAKCYIEGIGTSQDMRKGIVVLKRGIECGCEEIDKAKRLLKSCTADNFERK